MGNFKPSFMTRSSNSQSNRPTGSQTARPAGSPIGRPTVPVVRRPVVTPTVPTMNRSVVATAGRAPFGASDRLAAPAVGRAAIAPGRLPPATDGSRKSSGSKFNRGRRTQPVKIIPTGAMKQDISARTVEALEYAKNAVPVSLPAPENSPKLRVYALGGLEEVGRNCTVFECGDDIVIVDVGLMFPEENMPGIDFIVPNTTSLIGKEKNIRGIIVSHGHLDHIGGLPYILPKIGWPVIYTAPLTAGIIRNRQEEFGNGHLLKIANVTGKTRITLGKHFVFEPFHVNHNISDAFGTALHTPYGVILGTGDFKFDFTPADGDPADLIHIASYGAKDVLMLQSDSTNATVPGHQISEREVGEELKRTITKAKSRVIIGTFSSMLTRLQQILEIAESLNKKVLLQGRSLIKNVELAHKLGYMKYKTGTIIEDGEFSRVADDKIVVVCTGAQGEVNASLMRIANREHKMISIQPGDMVVFSSSVIPGNERTVQSLKDTLVRQGAKIVDNAMVDVHAGGHAKQEDLKLMLRLTKPRYFMPIHGNRFMLEAHAELAESVGTPRSNIFVADNGQVIEFDKNGARLTAEFEVADYVMIDGLGVGDISHVVLRDRQALAEDGMVVVIVKISKTGELIGIPDITSRGFIDLKENKEILSQACLSVQTVLDKHGQTQIDPENIKHSIREEVGKYLFQKTERRPMILPVLIEV